MDILTRDATGYRTRLMTETKAESFARCLRANAQYAHVSVCESNKSRSPHVRHYVLFSPSQEGRMAALLTRQQDARMERAHEQAGDYLTVRAEGFFYVMNLKNGNVYEATPRSCDCPDFLFRCEANGLRCKHTEVVLIHIQHARVQEFAPAVPMAA